MEWLLATSDIYLRLEHMQKRYLLRSSNSLVLEFLQGKLLK
jgi:hypothetical protein